MTRAPTSCYGAAAAGGHTLGRRMSSCVTIVFTVWRLDLQGSVIN
jgi:hypothetical protein